MRVVVENLEFRYRGHDGGFALVIPRLELASGEQVAVVGPSGSGKSTFLQLLGGILIPDRGRVCLGERDLAGMSDRDRRRFRARHVGFVFQGFELLDYLSVVDNILLPYRINRSLAPDAAVSRRARETAERLGLGALMDRKPDRLSQGERQRVAIARAILPAPEVLLGDEPTGNLDPENKSKILDLVQEAASDVGATLIVVTHDHRLLDRFSRVVDFASLGRAFADTSGEH